MKRIIIAGLIWISLYFIVSNFTPIPFWSIILTIIPIVFGFVFGFEYGYVKGKEDMYDQLDDKKMIKKYEK